MNDILGKLTPTMKRVLSLAEVEATKTDEFIGVKHVMIAMMLEGDNGASLYLKGAGFNPEMIRNVEMPNKNEQVI